MPPTGEAGAALASPVKGQQRMERRQIIIWKEAAGRKHVATVRNLSHTGDSAKPPEAGASSLKGVLSPRLRHFLTMTVEPTRVPKRTIVRRRAARVRLWLPDSRNHLLMPGG